LAYIGNKPANKAVVASDLDPAVITGQTALAVAPADTDEFLISDAGTLKRLDASLIGGGGKIGQVVQAVKTDTFTCTASSFTDVTGITVNITPSATSSKVLVMASLVGGAADETHVHFKLVRDSTDILLGDAASNRIRATTSTGPIRNTSQSENFSIQYLDSPSSTSAVTYKIQMQNQSGSLTSYINRSGADVDNTTFSRNTSTITVMEVLA